ALTRLLADGNVDETTFGTFAADMVAVEFGAGGDADGEIEGEGLARRRYPCVYGLALLVLQAVRHAQDGFVDHQAHADFSLRRTGHVSPSQTSWRWTRRWRCGG